MKLRVKSDGEDVIPQAEIIEADQYKRTYFGPDVPTLELQCWEEELSECQLASYKNSEEEHKSIQNKLDEIVKDTGGQVVYNGDQFIAYQLLGKQPALQDLERQSAEILRSRSRSVSVAKEPKKRGRPSKRARDDDKDYSPERDLSPEVKHKKKKKDKDRERTKDKDTKTKDKTLAPSNVHSVVTNIRPSEATAIGGLSTGATKTTAIVDLTKDDGTTKNVADSREVAFNKLQGKTFPSLVVVARPYLRAKDTNPPSDRTALDSKVKSVLMHTPTKFTEWLIQQGLVRSEQWCAIHPANKLKLGMYSDTTKFPYSGGYVWISECCPTRFVSVFCSSIFEGATHPPSVILKLIYHWACQTNVQNVVQWVKVDNLYVKALFTWLRAICTSAIHQHVGLLGGPGKKVEVGVISLGTTSHDGTQRQVKVEVLGVLDLTDKSIRLRAVEPLSEHEKNYKKRFQKILEPLIGWVHQSSTILTDLTVDKGTLVSMGFRTVHQSSNQTDHSKHSNANIMEYLRRIVPRMFQNTLSLLSRQIIQQFLDELVWREKYGITPGQAFDNIVTHLAEQTKIDGITARLNKIAANPFKAWKYPSKKSREDIIAEATSSKRGRRKKEPSPPPPPKRGRKSKVQYVPDDDDDEEMPLAQRKIKVKLEKDKVKETHQGRGRPRKNPVPYDPNDDVPLKVIKKEHKPEETVSMEKYYFGEIGGSGEVEKCSIAVECPTCFIEFSDNVSLMRHIYSHIVPPPEGADSYAPAHQCDYCMARFASNEDLETHVKQNHPVDTKTNDLLTYACVICEVRFSAVLVLSNHMQKAHGPSELPYKCDACDYRASAHRKVVDHFYKKHGKSTKVHCPKCLKIFPVYVNGHDMATNVNIYIDHLKQHMDRHLEAPCNRCTLKFVHLGQLKEHQIRDHDSVPGAKPFCVEEHLITKPKNKPRPPIKDATGFTIPTTFENLTLVLEDGRVCRECDTVLESDKHFLGVMNCTKCPFTSSCYRAQLAHGRVCAGPYSLEDAPRPAPQLSHCICGYSTKVGTDMLSHLLVCEHTTSYASTSDAKANIANNEKNDETQPETQTQREEKHVDEGEATGENAPTEAASTDAMSLEANNTIPEYAPPSVLNTQLSLDDLAPPSVLPPDTQPEQDLSVFGRGLATPRHEAAGYSLPEFEPLPQEPPPQPDFDQL